MSESMQEMIDMNAVAAGLARLVAAGEDCYLPGVADYGRAVIADEAPTEAHRRAMAGALSQPTVVHHYAQIALALGGNYTARAAMLRQIAIYVYARSAS